MAGHFLDLGRQIDRIYQAAVQPKHWRLFLQPLREELRATTLHLSLRLPSEGDRGVVLSLGMEESFADAYRDHFHSMDPWMPHISVEKEREVRTLEDFVSEAELVRIEFYNDWMRPQGILYGFGAFLCKSSPTQLVSSLAGFREKGGGPFQMEELDRIRLMVPHLQRALVIHRRLREAELLEGAAEEALDRISSGVILLDERGAPIVTNRPADQILAANDGLTLDRDGPRAALEEQNRELQRLLAWATTTGAVDGTDSGPVLRLARPSGRPALEVVVTPIRRESSPLFDHRATAAIFVAEPDAHAACSPEGLRRMHGLTPMEAEVASRLVKGVDLAGIGDDLGVTIHTVRGHLKRLFAKTGTHRQADLVRVLLSSPTRVLPY